MDIVIYGKDNCPFCVRAVDLCKNNGLEYTYRKIGEDLTAEMFAEQHPGVRTVPLIFVDDVQIGGYTEFSQWFQQSKSE